MENRRQYYRHAFSPARGLAVVCRSTDSTSTITGEMLDLSIGGLRMKCQGNEVPAGKRWIATFTLEPPVTLDIPVEQVHRKDEPAFCMGLRFLAPTSPRLLEERERLIWSFLLDEQRGQRREERAAKRA